MSQSSSPQSSNKTPAVSKKKPPLLAIFVTLVLSIFLICLIVFILRTSSSNSDSSPLLIESSSSLTPLHQYLLDLPDHSHIALKLGDHLLSDIEVVNTQASIIQGLSDRPTLGADGMLFVFPEATQTSFWMKNMHFNLDLLWFNNDELFGLAHDADAPAPNTPDNYLTLYPAPRPVTYVLEVPTGFALERGLKLDEQLTLP